MLVEAEESQEQLKCASISRVKCVFVRATRSLKLAGCEMWEGTLACERLGVNIEFTK